MKGPLLIIKIGGNIIDDETKLVSFLEAFAQIPGKKILVHGGGKLATRMAEKLGIRQQLVEGRRITDAETLKIITMVYAGLINKNIVASLQANHCNALGLTGADGHSILAHKRAHPEIDYGFAGDIDEINTPFISALLEKNITPVFAPITHDRQGQLLNTNADTIARELAEALSGEFETSLIFTFEKSGVLSNAEDGDSVIKSLNYSLYNQLRAEGKIFAGMIPKLDNAFEAIRRGVASVMIGNAENLPELINRNEGTSITHD